MNAEKTGSDRNALELASAVAKQVALKSVRLRECSITVPDREAPGGEMAVDMMIRAKAKPVRSSQDPLIVDVAADLRGRYVDASPDAGEEGFHLKATHRLMYEFAPDARFDADQISAFARVNGVYNAWPYVREFVQSLTVRMGLPALTLPLFNPQRPGVLQEPSERSTPAPERNGAGNA